MAGLTAAAYLSRAGLKVVLCEKEMTTGGLVNSFDHNGFVFDGGIRAIEDSGIVRPMLRQLGIPVDFLPSTVSIGIGPHVVRVTSKESLQAYQDLLQKCFPANGSDIAAIIDNVRQIMGYMDILYGIDNPLFLDLKRDREYLLRTILPWMFKFILTVHKVTRLNKPVYEHLATFSSNQALLDIIAQHFFQSTPAFFALSYFSLYLDYRYPKGGTGALARAVERFVLENHGTIETGTEITEVEPARHTARDSKGNVYSYRRLIWAADAKTLYRLANLSALPSTVVRRIQARQQLLTGKIGGDSVFTLYLTVNLDKTHFEAISSAHLFYTPSLTGLMQCSLSELYERGGAGPARITSDWPRIAAWLHRFLGLTTFEIACPALRDAGLAPEGKTGLIVSSLFDYALTRHIREIGRYDEFTRLVSERIIEVLDGSIYPGLKAAVLDSFTSTPLTIERITGNAEGAITGWAFTNESMPAVNKLLKVASSVLTPIPDTYQAGQWTYSPSGLPISILTGKLAADRVLKDLA
jgi:phytoene dehydrogenase-like protein